MVGFTMAGVCMAVFACVACVFMLCLRVRPVRWGSRAGAVWRTLSCVLMLCLHVWPVWPCVWPVWRCVCEKGGARGGPPSFVVCRRRCPTLPHPGGCSTIGAGSLSFRVRKGKRSGRVPAAVAAATLAGPDHAPALDGGRVWDSGIA